MEQPPPVLDDPSLAELLDIEKLEEDIFRGRSPDQKRLRVFGGQVAAQAVRAAQDTITGEGQLLHSSHAYFLRAGDYRVPILYRVDRIRDGRTFSTRRVVAIQHGEAIFNLEASFQRPEPGLVHQVPMADHGTDPDALDPDEFSAMSQLLDSRQVPPSMIPPEIGPARWIWFRFREELPDDISFGAAALTYASDHGPIGALRRPHAGDPRLDRMMAASLDHLIWYHRPSNLNDWHFYDLRPVSTAAARGLARGLIHSLDGVLVASVAQEGLIRPWRE